jgi:fructose-bisphosphate aldolase class II
MKDASNFDPRHFMKPSITYMQQVCRERYEQFWCAGHGSKIKQISLDDFAKKYASGELTARAAVKA